MSSKTKIIVLRMREVVYTGILAGVGLALIILLLIIFLPKKDQAPISEDNQSMQETAVVSDQISQALPDAPPSGILQETSGNIASYIPGIYKSELILGGKSVEVEAILEQDRIASLRLVNPDEVITTMYPLLQPTMDHICEQVYHSQSLEGITYASGTKYTSMVLMDAIRSCLEKGVPVSEESNQAQ